MGTAQKFMFESAFDQPDGENAAAPLPTHTDEEVAHIREEAFQAGHEAALVEAKKIEERRLTEMFAMMAQRIDALCETRAADTDEISRQAIEVATTICRKVLPEMARRHALTEIEGMIGDCLAAMPDEPRMVVRVADDMVDRLQERIVAIANGFDGKLVLLGDDELSPTDCAVVWADGGTERNLDRLWQDINSAIDRLLASQTAPTDPASTGETATQRNDPGNTRDETPEQQAASTASSQ